MHRRVFLVHVARALPAAVLVACGSGPIVADADRAGRRRQIDVAFYAALERIRAIEPAARPYIDKARGILLFPTIVTSGLNNNEIYGEGALQIANTMLRYYSLQSSAGLPAALRGEVITLLFLFMQQEALDQFLVNQSWRIGTGAPVTAWGAALREPGNEGRAVATILSLPLDRAGIIANFDVRGMAIAPLDL